MQQIYYFCPPSPLPIHTRDVYLTFAWSLQLLMISLLLQTVTIDHHGGFSGRFSYYMLHYVLVYMTQVNLTTNSPKCYASLGQLVNRPIMATSNVSLKLLVDTKASRVLYAEAGKDFVDFLFSLLHLPVGTVSRLLIKDSMVGSLGNLYESIENLNETYWLPNQNKESLLKPKTPPCASGVPMLLPRDISTAKRFYTCPKNGDFQYSYSSHEYHPYICDDSSTLCPRCNRSMSKEVTYVTRSTENAVSADKGGFVQGVITYMVMDDLVVKPTSVISSITLLNKFNVKDLSALEEKVVDFGMDEGLKLLKASLQTKTVLTSIFLGNTGVKVE